MKFKILAAIILSIFVSGCTSGNPETIESIGGEPFTSLRFKDEKADVLNISELPMTEADKIEAFLNLVQNVQFEEVGMKKYNEYYFGMKNSEEVKAVTVFALTSPIEEGSSPDTGMDGVNVTISDDGRILASFFEDHLGKKFYQSVEKDKSLYSQVFSYYRDNIEVNERVDILEMLEEEDQSSKIE
ncbi:hypothetical protein [Bacillus sp. AK031]